MKNLTGRLARLEQAIKPAEEGALIVVDLTDEPNRAEAERRMVTARTQAGPAGHIIKVVFGGIRYDDI